MNNTEIAKYLSALCGLKVKTVCAELDAPVCEDAAQNRTLFTVMIGGKPAVFCVDGTGEHARAVAALCRSIAGELASRDVQDPLCEFLNGKSDVPPVRLGKSDYYVFAVYGKTKNNTVKEYLTTMSDADDLVVAMPDGITAFCKKIEPEAYSSAGEFASVLHENLAEEAEGVKIGVGGVAHGVSELPLYYSYAKTSLAVGVEFDPTSEIYSYKEYALISVLSELSRGAAEKYVMTALDKNYRAVLADSELMSAADAFIKHSLNISEAARSMYMHRNTLIYRLDKIEKMTGLNIRNFNDAMSFRVAYLIYKSLN